MVSVYVVSRTKAGGGYTTDTPDRVYFHEHRAKAFVDRMNGANKERLTKDKTWYDIRYTYRKMSILGRKVNLKPTDLEPEPEVTIETPMPTPEPVKEETPPQKKRGRPRKNKDETKTKITETA